MPEILTTTPETISQATLDKELHNAADRISEQMNEPGFHSLRMKAGVDIDYLDPMYWQKMAEYTSHQISTESKLSPLEKEATGLIGYLPNVLFQTQLLKYHVNNENILSDSEARNAKRTACAYNNLLKDFVRKYPQSADHLKANLLGSVLQTVGGDSYDFTDYADKKLDDILRGVKHEVGFATILDSLGVTYRDATISEDLKGRDFVVSFNGHEIGIDIKASLDQIAGKNNGYDNGFVAHKPSGDLVMFSMLLDTDFQDGFIPDPERIEEIAPKAGGILQAAILQSIAKK